MHSHNFYHRSCNGQAKPKLCTSEGDGYYGLHKQCLLVNLDYYKKFDKPVYGSKNER